MNLGNITLLGAGLVGSMLATFLARRGYQVHVYEKRPDMRKGTIEGGRSINLALSHRGLRALEKIDLLEKVTEICLPMKGRIMHDLSGSLSFQPYGREGEYINSISRGQLNVVLMNAAASAGVQIDFNEECIGAEIDQGITSLNGPKGNHQVKSDYIVGADGAFSGLREALRITERFDFSQYYLPHGYKELTIPPTVSGDFALDPEALHIWPREQFMLIALPNNDRSFTCTLFLPFQGNESFEQLGSHQEVFDFFKKWFSDVTSLMPDLTDDYFAHPSGSMVTIRCNPWQKGKACLIGDASHAIVPFYGQGMNAGFEDCRLFDETLSRFDGRFDQAFTSFQKQRIPNTNAIADLAFQNFVEMRDLVADSDFLLRKKIEQKIQELYPAHWTPLYSMVTFSDRPYNEALKIGKIQQSIMDEVLQQPNIETEWESLDFQRLAKDLKARVDST